jgi:hypothetical protein
VPSQKAVNLGQCGKRRPRRAEVHAAAGHAVQHPLGHHRHDAGGHLNVDEAARLPLVDPLDADPTAEQRMKPVVDNRMLPDMGRMNG